MKSNNKIFVSIASYRDKLCPDTIKSMFENATSPSNVYAGVCQQNKEDEDIDALQDIPEHHHNNIKIIRIPHYEAKGPTWARYLCSTLYNNEDYFMQVDSHTKFVKDWDTKCINMLNELKNKGVAKPILSHYPREYSDALNYNDTDKNMVPKMCKAFWNNRGMISFMGAETSQMTEPTKHFMLAGGMIFSDGKFVKEVPFDPKLDFLFVGEEIGHSARAYTYGYDIFNPSENIVFHFYTRPNDPKIWTDNKMYSDVPAFNKVKYYLQIDDTKLEDLSPDMKLNIDKYGLGPIRTLDEFYKEMKIDKENKTVASNFCRANNNATEEDIKNSNERNHKKENFMMDYNIHFSFREYILFGICFIAIILWFWYLLKHLRIDFK